MVSAKCTTTH